MKQKISFIQLGLMSVALFAVSLIFGATDTFAATKTWTGGGSDSNWSTAANWNPSGAPVDGDDLVFENSTSSSIQSVNDISSLIIDGIVFNVSGTGGLSFSTHHPLTLNGDVIANTNSSGTQVGINGDIVLGTSVSIVNVALYEATSPISGTGDTLVLDGHALTLQTNSNFPGSTLAQDLNITGTGTVNIDVRNSISLYLSNGSSYTGTTNLISGTITNSSSASSNTIFGSSTVNVGPTATLSLNAQGSTWTFNNPINIAAAVVGSSGYLDNQLYIWANEPGQTINIPNITLNGNARFYVNHAPGANVTVNLAGITANGFCVQYGGENNWQTDRFINGPPACVIGSSVDFIPGVPNTGEFVANNYGLVVASVVAAVGGATLVFAKRRSISRITRR